MLQRIPSNWKGMAIAYTLHNRQRFNDEDVDVVIDSDKTFLCLHKALLPIVVPKGENLVGSAVKNNYKEGCALMI